MKQQNACERVLALLNETVELLIRGESEDMDLDQAEADVVEAGRELVRRHNDVRAIVLECTNMTPYARALADHLLLPVYSIYSFVTWFHAGLAPRDFGPPASGPRPWRER